MSEHPVLVGSATTVIKSTTPVENKGTARRRTIKMFRHFLKALDAELHLYNWGTTQNEFSMLCFLYIRRAVRAVRDEPPNIASQACVVAVLDLVTAWDDWISRQRFSQPLLMLHETLGRMVKGALKGWRTYWIRLQLSDTPVASLNNASSTLKVDEGDE